MTLPAEDESPAAARLMVLEAMTDFSDDIRDTVALMTSELVTNVIQHADGDVRVTFDLGPPIRVEVHNHAAATAAFRQLVAARPGKVAVTSASGRGLTIVHDLSTRIGLSDDPAGGKAVWFELDYHTD